MRKMARTMALCTLVGAGFLLTAERVDAAKVSWRKDFQQAAQESTRNGKPILVEITASWCHYCHKMLENTFTEAAVAEHVNGCFVPVTIDADAQSRLVDSMGVRGLPTTVVISPEMKVLKRITGYQSAEQLQKHLEEICGGHKKQETATPAPLVAAPAESPLAFEGTCLVTLRDEQALAAGVEQFAAEYRGHTVRFASEEFQRRFLANPEQYWPMWDGNCVVTAVQERVKRPGLPQYGAIYRGRLWFFADAEQRAHFMQSAAEYPAEK